MQRNPWHNLPTAAPYVLPEDRLAVDVFNRSANEKIRLHVETAPEPFLGPIDAPIVVLLLNPGVDKVGEYDTGLADAIRRSDDQTSHFYIGGGNRWWRTLTKSLAAKRPVAGIARSILSVEFFPYRSISFGCGHVRLPSQTFSFELVRRAMRRKAAIVIARGERQWIGAVPELSAGYPLLRLSNPRMASLSANNLGSEGHVRLIAALDRAL